MHHCTVQHKARISLHSIGDELMGLFFHSAYHNPVVTPSHLALLWLNLGGKITLSPPLDDLSALPKSLKTDHARTKKWREGQKDSSMVDKGGLLP